MCASTSDPRNPWLLLSILWSKNTVYIWSSQPRDRHRDGARDIGREPGRDPALDPGPGTGSLSSFLKGKWILPNMDRVGFLGMFGSRFLLNIAMTASFPHMMQVLFQTCRMQLHWSQVMKICAPPPIWISSYRLQPANMKQPQDNQGRHAIANKLWSIQTVFAEVKQIVCTYLVLTTISVCKFLLCHSTLNIIISWKVMDTRTANTEHLIFESIAQILLAGKDLWVGK